jgi:hypothetical protein
MADAGDLLYKTVMAAVAVTISASVIVTIESVS